MGITLRDWYVGERARASSRRYNRLFGEIRESLASIWNRVIATDRRVDHLARAAATDAAMAARIADDLATTTAAMITSVDSVTGDAHRFWTPMESTWVENASAGVALSQAYGYLSLAGTAKSHLAAYTDESGRKLAAEHVRILVDDREVDRDDPARVIANGELGSRWIVPARASEGPHSVRIETGTTGARRINYVTVVPCPLYASRFTVSLVVGGTKRVIARDVQPNGHWRLTFPTMEYNGAVVVDLTPVSVSPETAYVGLELVDFGEITYADAEGSADVVIPLDAPTGATAALSSFLVFSDGRLVAEDVRAEARFQVYGADPETAVYDSAAPGARWPFLYGTGAGTEILGATASIRVRVTLRERAGSTFRLGGIAIAYR